MYVRGSQAASHLARAEEAKDSALQRQLVELTGSAAEIAALREEEEKEARIELLRRQVGRRLFYRDLARGWTAWAELWHARTDAMARLKHCGNKLRAPELANAFNFWAADAEQSRRVAAWRELEARANSIEAQLRRARYESKQTAMVRTAQEDEIRALRREVEGLNETKREQQATLAEYAHLPEDLGRARRLQAKAEEDAKEAIEKREEAEADVLVQLDGSQASAQPSATSQPPSHSPRVPKRTRPQPPLIPPCPARRVRAVQPDGPLPPVIGAPPSPPLSPLTAL